jgi:hypothetical protein
MYWTRLGSWISPRYWPFSLGARFETYEPFISLIFLFFSGCGQLKPQILGHNCTLFMGCAGKLKPLQ